MVISEIRVVATIICIIFGHSYLSIGIDVFTSRGAMN